jgi:hypothetical protein
MYAGFRSEHRKGKGYLEEPGVDGRMILKSILNEEGVDVWT